MPGETILVAGKALLIFGIPLGLAAFELWRLRRDRERGRTQGDGNALARERHGGTRGDAALPRESEPGGVGGRTPGDPPTHADKFRP